MVVVVVVVVEVVVVVVVVEVVVAAVVVGDQYIKRVAQKKANPRTIRALLMRMIWS